MANLVIVSHPNYIDIEFNDLSSKENTHGLYTSRRAHWNIVVPADESYVLFEEADKRKLKFCIACDEPDCSALIVDNVNGIAPTSNHDLAHKLADLML